MARQARIDVPGYPQHLVVRGNNRGPLFGNDADRLVFLRFMEDALSRAGPDLHAFVLMSNHVHLLATGHRPGQLSEFMHHLGSKFARLMNQRWGRTGTLFEGRFRSSVVESDAYLVTCMRYIDLNPVRAGLVRHPADHAWSSFRRNAGMVPLAPLVASPAYLGLGETAESRGIRYRALCEAGLPESDVACIRESIRQSRTLGSPAFVKAVERLGGRPSPDDRERRESGDR